MAIYHTNRWSNRRRVPLVVVAIMLALVLLVVGVRQVTVQLRGGDDRLSTVPAAGVADPGGLTGQAGEVPEGQDAGDPAEGGAPQAEGDPVRGTMNVGPVVADEEFVFTPQPDEVTVEPGPGAAARAAPELPGDGPGGSGPAPGTDGGDDGNGDGPGTHSGPSDGSSDNGPVGGPIPVDPNFTMGARVETEGHRAAVHVGVGAGLDGGLAALTVDFGDGTARFEFDDDEIARLRNGGFVKTIHTYEPTLTPSRRPSWSPPPTAPARHMSGSSSSTPGPRSSCPTTRR